MGNTTICCCDGRAQLENSSTFSFNAGKDTDIRKIKSLKLSPEKPQITALIQKASSSKYFSKPTSKTNPIQTILQGDQKNAAIYEGEVLDGKAHGYGKAQFENGYHFQGTFEKGEPTNGVFIFNDQCYYVGNIQKLQAAGQGFYENIGNGYSYEGQWKKNLQHGHGGEKYPNSDQYEGEFMFGSKFGQGRYRFADGRIYEGSFYNGHSDGYGKITMTNGQVYEGEWKLGQIHGKGTYSFGNGEKYVGSYEHGKKHGDGTYYYSSGARYEGNWVNGFQEGEGSIVQGFDEVRGIWQSGNFVGSL